MRSKRKHEKGAVSVEKRVAVKGTHDEVRPEIKSTKAKRSTGAIAPVLRVLTGSYEHQLLCLSLAVGVESFASKKLGDTDEFSESSLRNLFTPIFHFSPHTASIRCIAHAKRYLVTGGNDEHIRLYDLQKRKEIGTLMHHEGSVTCLEFVNSQKDENADQADAGVSGKWLVSGGEDGKVLIWRTKDWEVLADMKGHKGAVNDISVHPSGKIALSVGRDRTLRLWNLMTAKNASVMKVGGPEAIQVRWNAAGDKYAVGSQQKIVVYDMSATILSTIKLPHPLYKLHYVSLADRTGSTTEYLVISDSTGAIVFRNVSQASEEDIPVSFELKAHSARVKDFEFFTRSPPDILIEDKAEAQPKITFMCSVSSDGKIVTWNLNTRVPIAIYETNERLNCCTVVAEEVEKYESRKLSVAEASETEGELEDGSEDEK
ncbi:WD40-repeat-containing domain protein [Lipomyces arxii]|uniref:WD40-repeat-containing domain protein n=1 Tax=Lipomyces arxii TaxID=56418 RepID=UPI0034CE24A3